MAMLIPQHRNIKAENTNYFGEIPTFNNFVILPK